MIDTNKLDELNSVLEMMNPAEILYWLSQNRSERVVATSSFQARSLPLLFLLNKIIPMTPVLFLDTEFHFRNKLNYTDDIQNRKLN